MPIDYRERKIKNIYPIFGHWAEFPKTFRVKENIHTRTCTHCLRKVGLSIKMWCMMHCKIVCGKIDKVGFDMLK